jgi:hypothetical protein
MVPEMGMEVCNMRYTVLLWMIVEKRMQREGLWASWLVAGLSVDVCCARAGA